jgi:hypothetical protein
MARKPQELDAEQVKAREMLANQVMSQLELRRELKL